MRHPVRTALLSLVLSAALAAPALAQTRETTMGSVVPPKHGTTQTAQQFSTLRSRPHGWPRMTRGRCGPR